VVSKEIERKFLVKGSFKEHAISSMVIKQGFLSTVPERTVRVRTKGDKAFITIKGIGNTSGISRFEWEKEIPMNEAIELLKICEPGAIDKIRFIVPIKDGLCFEVDEFLGQNKGLIIAEIELPSEDTPFDIPDWLGVEVTGVVKYYNSYLAQNPYNKWINK
jgi:adenylate cyclase